MSAAEEYRDREKVWDWLVEQSTGVERYLERQRVKSESPVPRWELAPYVAVWQIDGGWVVSGDLPTDYVLDEAIQSPRDALRFFADKFAQMAECMLAGRKYSGTQIGDPTNTKQQRELGDLLRRRASLLSDFVDNDGLWSDELDEWQEKPE
jgi:hypothetical protein